jgi:NADPH:quinone reductase-like Zn-dependent oxidoreductase
MRAAVFSRAGDAAVVARVKDVPVAPEPGAGEVQLRIIVSPVHRGDLANTEGASFARGGSSHHPLGTEAVGVLTAVGKSVENLRVGDRVAVFPAQGAWAERVTVPAEAAVVVPNSFSDETASVLLVNTLTSREVLSSVDELRAVASAGDDAPLVMSAAASAVGKLIVQQAVDLGRPVIAAVRSDRSAATVRELVPVDDSSGGCPGRRPARSCRVRGASSRAAYRPCCLPA